MPAAVYRFQFNGPSIAAYLQNQVGGAAITLGTLSPQPYIDINADTAQVDDLTAAMLQLGYSLSATNPATTPAQQAATTNLTITNHVFSTNTTIPAGSSFEMSRYIEIAAGVTVEIGVGADLEIS